MRFIPLSGSSLVLLLVQAMEARMLQATHFTIASRAKTCMKPYQPTSSTHFRPQVMARRGLTFEQHPPNIKLTIMLQDTMDGNAEWIMMPTKAMALSNVILPSNPIPGFAFSKRGPTLISFVRGGMPLLVMEGGTFRRRGVVDIS